MVTRSVLDPKENCLYIATMAVLAEAVAKLRNTVHNVGELYITKKHIFVGIVAVCHMLFYILY